MSIQRYIIQGKPLITAPEMIKYSDGNYVLYSDHLAALKEKETILAIKQETIEAQRNRLIILETELLTADLRNRDKEVECLTKGLRNVLYQGHNEDCLLCGFKDKIAIEALKEKP